MTLLQYRFGLFLILYIYIYIDRCVFARGACVCVSEGEGWVYICVYLITLYFITTENHNFGKCFLFLE